MEQQKVYWYLASDYPDEIFFKYKNRQPSSEYCFFSSRELALVHNYNRCKWIAEKCQGLEVPNLLLDEQTLQRFYDDNEFKNFGGEIIEIPLDVTFKKHQ